MFDPRKQTYEEYLAEWEREIPCGTCFHAYDLHGSEGHCQIEECPCDGWSEPANPFEPAEYENGQPFPPSPERDPERGERRKY